MKDNRDEALILGIVGSRVDVRARRPVRKFGVPVMGKMVILSYKVKLIIPSF